jgi:putative MATE family efflux protein
VQEYTERLGYAPLGRLLLRLSLPGIASTVTASLYNVVDTFWVARLGHEAIAALTIVFPYQILFIAVAVGTGIGITSLVSRRFGERNLEATDHIAGQIFFLSLGIGLIFMLAAVLFSERILVSIGATPDILEFADQYLVIISYGAPMIIFALVSGQLIRGSGDAVKPMIIMISASVLNMILDPLMILGIGPFPEMGIRGAAWATVIAQFVGAALALFYLLAHRTTYKIQAKHLPPDLSVLKDIYRVGAPSMILELTESFAFVLFNIVVSSFGSVAIAAVGLVIRISDLAFMPIIGVSNGLLPIIGYNFGARLFHRLWKATVIASLGIAALLAVATVVIEVLAPQIIGIFSQEAELMETTVPAIRILLSTLILIGPTIMFITVFQGLSRGVMALILSLVRQFLLFIPLLYLFRHLWGLTGVWWSMPVSDTLSFVITYLIVYREYRKHKKAGFLMEVSTEPG